MKKVLFALLLFSAISVTYSQSNSDQVNKNIIKKVILIDNAPYEVLMNSNGDIVAKLSYLPDYLKAFEEGTITLDSLNELEDSDNLKKIDLTDIHSEVAIQTTNTKLDSKSETLIGDKVDITFKGSTALLESEQIKILNDVIVNLKSGNIKSIKLFGFVNEPEYRSAILSERRMQAIMAYLKIKGIDIDKMVQNQNTVEAHNNKVVIAYEK